MMSPSPSVISPDSVQLSSKRPRSPTVIQPSRLVQPGAGNELEGALGVGQVAPHLECALDGVRAVAALLEVGPHDAEEPPRHGGFAAGAAFVVGCTGARPLIISQSGPASEVQRCAVCVSGGGGALGHGACCSCSLSRGWLWCDGLRAAVRMQPYELCLRVLRRYFAGLWRHARLVMRS